MSHFKGLHGTPFWHGSTASGPAGGIFLLEQGRSAAVERVGASDALPELLAAGGAPLDLPEIQQAFFAALGSLLRRIPVYRLRFALDEDFWGEVDARPEFACFRAPGRPPGVHR